MILSLEPRVTARLNKIERQEGIPPVEVAHQAVAVWCELTADERRSVGFFALQLVTRRLLGGAR
ncbi:hypothetical protein NPA31_005255 [Aurantimonas sp. MSK8Z-1]|uniref:hypothetical protein n=1 Tax=Mangrovibrevibacter kandeliae TaxID=2968473 RepID=UPI002118390D|nr:hypothetical protein [Aurantimonas sp. MSK8Z-1]MCW4114369.1 hypothetical protein [Aurantimonas sp. MSK8Z-1]